MRRMTLLVIGVFCLALQTTALPEQVSRQPASPLWHSLQQSDWIAVGSTRPRHVVYIFTDPNCPYCHDLWLALRPYYHQGLQVRNVLVDVISDSSPGKAAAILQARSPLAALNKNEGGWGLRSDGGGGIAPLLHPQPNILNALNAHVALMMQFGISGTPGLVFKDNRGELHVIAGLPNNAALTAIIHSAAAPQ